MCKNKIGDILTTVAGSIATYLQQIIMVLHSDKLGPAVLLGDSIHLRELPCPHGARSNIPNFS